MAENLQREDFNPMEIASLLEIGVEKLGLQPKELAKKFGKDVAWITAT